MLDSLSGGVRALRCLDTLRRESVLDADSLKRLQDALLARLAKSAAKTGFYRHLSPPSGGSNSNQPPTSGGMPVDLESFPITEREDVRLGPDGFFACDETRHHLTSMTSGSSGTPVEVRSDREATAWRNALSIASLLDAGVKPMSLCARIHRKESAPGRIRMHYFFRMLGLSLFDDERANLTAIRKFGPQSLICCSSYAQFMAKENDYAEKPVKFKQVICGSEVTGENARREISRSFSCPVFDVYGCHEFGHMAWECPEEHSMHVSSRFIIEIVDGRGRPARNGPGEVLVTALHNHAMPLIRYRIGDRASWGKECPCGRGLPVIASIEGRTNEVFALPGGGIRPAACFSNIESLNGRVKSFQLIQEREDLFVLRFVPCGKGLDDSVRGDVESIVRKACGGARILVEFEEAQRIPREENGKFRKFYSKVGKG